MKCEAQRDLICRIEREMGLMFNEDWRPPIEQSDWNNRLQFSGDLNTLLWLVGVVRGPWNYSKPSSDPVDFIRLGCNKKSEKTYSIQSVYASPVNTNKDAEEFVFIGRYQQQKPCFRNWLREFFNFTSSAACAPLQSILLRRVLFAKSRPWLTINGRVQSDTIITSDITSVKMGAEL